MIKTVALVAILSNVVGAAIGYVDAEDAAGNCDSVMPRLESSPAETVIDVSRRLPAYAVIRAIYRPTPQLVDCIYD